MAEITLSPVPYGGGTLIPAGNRHFTRLTSTRFVAAYAQYNPNYVIIQVMDVDNIKATTPVVTNVRTQILSYDFVSVPSINFAVRVTRFNDTDFLLAYTEGTGTVSAVACRVDPVTAVVTVLTATPISWTNFSGTFSSVNWNTQFWATNENIVLHDTMTAKSQTYGTGNLSKIELNTSTGALTRTAIYSYTNINNYYASFSYLGNMRTGSNFVYSVGGSTTNGMTTRDNLSTYQSTFRIAVIDPVGGTATQLTTETTSGLPIIALSENNVGFKFSNSNTYRKLSSGSFGSNVTYATGTTSYPTWGTWVNSDYFLLETSTGVADNTAAIGRSYRVVRYVDDNYIESTAQTTPPLLRFNTANLSMSYGANNSRELFDPETILTYGYNTSTGAFSLRVLYSGL